MSGAITAADAADVGASGASDTSMPADSLHSLLAAAGSLGPSAADLVKDYADAYASMKETMEIRLRHEQRRCDFLQV